MATKIDQLSISPARESRTVLGHYPVLLAISITCWWGFGALVGLLSSNNDPLQMSIVRHSVIAMVPIAALLGLSILAATYVPKRWIRQIAMWSALAGIVSVGLLIKP
jgi:hypothetical protein